MADLASLTPGDQITLAGITAVYVAQTQHPIWPHLQLVIWRMGDGTWSHDALSPRQEIGDVTPSTPDERAAWLRAALLGDGARHG